MASSNSSAIGRGTFVRGRVTGEGDLEIGGRVAGDVVIRGEVTVDTTGLVASNIEAIRIVVRGAVKGDLTADETIHIEDGARVVGDLRAPRIAIGGSALVRGHVQTGNAGPARARAAVATASRPQTTKAQEPAQAARRKEEPPPPRAVPAPPPRPKAAAAPPKAPPPVAKAPANNKPAQRPSLAARIGPPAPIVPVLKKGTKAMQKKK